MVRNSAVESVNNILTINAMVQPASGSLHPRTYMGMFGRNNSIQLSGLGSIFQYKEKNSMVEESLKEYSLASAEVSYEDPG